MHNEESEPKARRQRKEKYDTKLAINGTFEQVIAASFLGKPPKEEEKVKIPVDK